MDVQGQWGTPPDRGYHRNTNGDVGDKGPIHHIYMEPIGGGNPANIPLQIDKIGGENGRCDLCHSVRILSVIKKSTQICMKGRPAGR